MSGLYDVVEVKKSKAVKVAQYIDEQSANNSVDKNLREDYFDLYEKGLNVLKVVFCTFCHK